MVSRQLIDLKLKSKAKQNTSLPGFWFVFFWGGGLFVCMFVWDRVSYCRQGRLWTQDNPPTSAFWGLWTQACTTGLASQTFCLCNFNTGRCGKCEFAHTGNWGKSSWWKEDEMQAERNADLERGPVIVEDEPHVLHKLSHVRVTSPSQLFLDDVQPHSFLHTLRCFPKLETETAMGEGLVWLSIYLPRGPRKSTETTEPVDPGDCEPNPLSHMTSWHQWWRVQAPILT